MFLTAKVEINRRVFCVRVELPSVAGSYNAPSEVSNVNTAAVEGRSMLVSGAQLLVLLCSWIFSCSLKILSQIKKRPASSMWRVFMGHYISNT